MYCGEGDTEDCIEAINAQTGVTIEHVLIGNLPEKEAHNQLWTAWRDRQGEFDMFVKVDADTVMATQKTILHLWNEFEANPRVTSVQAPLHDYMTDSFINGLNAFHPKVVFRDTKDDLYCDRVDVNHDIQLHAEDLPSHLKPAGYHCHRATELQAFHYGVHRMLKNQGSIIRLVGAAWKKKPTDRVRGMALIGARMAARFKSGSQFNYTDIHLLQLFGEAHRRYHEFIKDFAVGR